MDDEMTLFLFGTGAGTCIQIPDLIRALLAKGFTLYSVLTPNVVKVTAPAPLMEIPGNHWIHTYGQPPLDRYPFGTLLVAPCTFNTFKCKRYLWCPDTAFWVGYGLRLIR